MGRKVNVVLPSGRVVSVDEDVAKASKLSRDTLLHEAGASAEQADAEIASGVVEGVKAGLEGAADTATFGLYGAVRGAIDPEGAEYMRNRAEHRSGARLVGEMGALVAPSGLLGRTAQMITGVTAPGLSRTAGKIIGGVDELGNLTRAGTFVEGTALGAGGYIAGTNVTGDPLTVESLVISAGIGGILDLGIHTAANKLEGLAWKAKRGQAMDRVAAEEAELGQRAKSIFDDTPPSWKEFVDLHEAKRASVKKYNAEVRKEAEAYAEHLTPAGLNDVIKGFDNARNEVTAQVSRDPAVRDALAQHSRMTAEYERLAKDYEKLAVDDEAFTQRLNQIQKVLKTKKKEFAPRGVDDLHETEVAGYLGKMQGERFIPQKKGSKYQTGRKKQPISEGLEMQLKEYNRRLSRIYQLKTGKYKGELGQWEKAGEGAVSFGDAVQEAAAKAQSFGERKAFISSVYENLPAGVKPKTLDEFKDQLFEAHKRGEVVLERADLVGAMDQSLVGASQLSRDGADFHFIAKAEKAAKAAGDAGAAMSKEEMYQLALQEAAALRRDLAGHFGGKKLPKIPEKPVPPKEPDVLVNGRTAELVGASREIAKGVEDARTLMRDGRYEDASLVLSDLRARIGSKAKDLVLPDMPLAPRQLLPEIAVDLPKSVDDFTRKHADQIAELAKHVGDEQTQLALYRVMKDFDLAVKGNPAEDLASMHKTLGDYRRTMKSLEDKAKVRAAEDAKAPLLSFLRRAAMGAGGRSADIGGSMGGATRVLGREAVGRSMSALEGAALGYAATGDKEGAAFGALAMTSRQGIRSRLRNLVAKYGVPAAGAARRFAAPTAYLKSSFLSGEEDPETDPRKLAVNRIHELQSAAMAAPDAAFLALQGMLGQPDDVAWKMHQHVVGSLNYLVSTLPRDPGTDTKMFSSNWSPQYHEAIALAHRLEAATDPLTAIARAIAGDSHPAATEALWALYPTMMNELAHEISVAAPDLKNLTYEQASAYSNLFRTPLTGLQQPVVVSTIQGIYMSAPSAAPQTPGPRGGAAKNAPGRPPAVQSPVAGANPAAHQGQ